MCKPCTCHTLIAEWIEVEVEQVIAESGLCVLSHQFGLVPATSTVPAVLKTSGQDYDTGQNLTEFTADMEKKLAFLSCPKYICVLYMFQQQCRPIIYLNLKQHDVLCLASYFKADHNRQNNSLLVLH